MVAGSGLDVGLIFSEARAAGMLSSAQANWLAECWRHMSDSE